MKANRIRVPLLLICLLLLLPCVTACGQNEEDPSSSGADTTAASEAATDDPVAEALSRLSDVDWGGDDFCILYSNDIGGYEEEIYSEGYGGAEGKASIISDAVYDRNTVFAETCSMNLVIVGKGYSSVGGSMSAEAHSPTGDYHLFTMPADQTTSHATSCELYNYLDTDIDFEQPWWDLGTVEFALDGKIFFMNGAWNIVDDDVTYVLMFNKKLINDRGMDSPYDLVRSNTWTLDRFIGSLKGTAGDANGDGKMNAADFYGMDNNGALATTLFFGAGLRYVLNSRDMDTPELALKDSMMDKALKVLDTVRELTMGPDHYAARTGDTSTPTDIFVEGRAIYFHECCSYLRSLNSQMDGDYGVVPPPKYDADQTYYRAWTHGIGSTFSVPVTIEKHDEIGGVLETLAVLSQQYLKPAYYDNMLTKRNVRDADSSDMLDIIMSNRVYDMGMYFGELGLSEVFSGAAHASTNNFSSSYTKAEKQFDKRITRIMANLQKMG